MPIQQPRRYMIMAIRKDCRSNHHLIAHDAAGSIPPAIDPRTDIFYDYTLPTVSRLHASHLSIKIAIHGSQTQMPATPLYGCKDTTPGSLPRRPLRISLCSQT
jgi:hypothetical protein